MTDMLNKMNNNIIIISAEHCCSEVVTLAQQNPHSINLLSLQDARDLCIHRLQADLALTLLDPYTSFGLVTIFSLSLVRP